MANDNSKNSPPEMSRQRRSSVSNPLTNLLRSGPGATAFPSPINDQRRRLSITTLGLPGTSPTTTGAVSGSPFLGLRRGSISTNNSDAIDENAVEDDEPTSARTAPTTPFTRHMSFGTNAMRNLRMPPGASPGGSNGRPSPPLRRSSGVRGPPSPPTNAASSAGMTWNKTSQASIATSPRVPSDLISARSDQGFNWPEQLRSRAESIAAGARPTVSYATSPPRGNAGAGAASMQSSGPRHDRAKSVSDMPAPPAQTPKPRPQKPDHFQERILKGDFYMD
jgi:hypothetical protein